jgi:hypothetical protein
MLAESIMPFMTVRNVPAKVIQSLKALAPLFSMRLCAVGGMPVGRLYC